MSHFEPFYSYKVGPYVKKCHPNHHLFRSEFIETTVEALGGSPSIAAPIMDFYSPSFKGRFIDWLNSIQEFPKPYDMTFGRLPELFDINVDSLFNEGNPKGGCLSDTLETDSTGRKYFVDRQLAKVPFISMSYI